MKFPLVVSDAQKLFVAGATRNRCKRFRQVVANFDQLPRFVEIEAQTVELPVAAIQEFGIATVEFNGSAAIGSAVGRNSHQRQTVPLGK